MKTSAISTARFYESLGRLFYAIAAADGRVQNKEMSALKNLVRQEWVANDHTPDAFGSDAPFQIEYMFEWLSEQRSNVKSNLGQFSDYYTDHKHLFTEEIKRRTWKTASAIAAAFSGRNKAELVMLQQVRMMFES